MPFRTRWVRRPGVTFLTGRKSVFSNGERHQALADFEVRCSQHALRHVDEIDR